MWCVLALGKLGIIMMCHKFHPYIQFPVVVIHGCLNGLVTLMVEWVELGELLGEVALGEVCGRVTAMAGMFPQT